MTTKLTQRYFFKVIRKFEIAGGAVNVRIKTPLKEEEFSVVLSILNPDPVVNGNYLEFRGRVQPCVLLALRLNKPSVREFNDFVATLKERAAEEYSAFAGIASSAHPGLPDEGLQGTDNEFLDSEHAASVTFSGSVDVREIDSAIAMLREHVGTGEIGPFVSALDALKLQPESGTCFEQLVNEFNNLGPMQGAVLTYAPYVITLMSDDPYEDH